jgi:hypothetical protein
MNCSHLEFVGMMNPPVIQHCLPNPLFVLRVNPSKLGLCDTMPGNLTSSGGCYIFIGGDELSARDYNTLGHQDVILIRSIAFIGVLDLAITVVQIVTRVE